MISTRPSYWFFIQIKIRPSQLTFVFCFDGDTQIEPTIGCRETNLALQLQKSSRKWLNGVLIRVFYWASDPPLKVMSIWSQILDKLGNDMQIHPWWCVSPEDAENGNANERRLEMPMYLMYWRWRWWRIADIASGDRVADSKEMQVM